MRYLHLRFIDAALYLKNNDVFVNCENSYYHFVSEPYHLNIKTPIGVNQISNMLHAMLGTAPIPTKRDCALKYYKEYFQDKELYDLAKNHTFIKYTTPFKYNDEKSEKENMHDLEKLSSFTQAAKPSQNSKVSSLTKIGDTVVKGTYNWNYFRRCYHSKDEIKFYKKLVSFFNLVLMTNDVVTDFDSFGDFAFEFRKHFNDGIVKDFLNDNKNDVSNILKNDFLCLLFRRKIKGNEYEYNDKIDLNTTYSSPTPQANNKGVTSKVNFNGELIVEIENEELFDKLQEFGCIPTIMDGGLIEVIGCKKFPPYPDWKDIFDKISEEEVTETVVAQ